MRRREFLGTTGLALLLPGLARLAGSEELRVEPLEKTKQEWKDVLEPARYRVLFEEDTEPAGTSALLKETRDGLYICAACFLPLFESDKKYESGTGWPSFWDAIPGRTGSKIDFKLGYGRREYHCIRCSGHQGHVFPDGPRPTGKRWCNNGLALLFVPEGEELPALRS